MSRKTNIISAVVAVVIICTAVSLCAVAVIRNRDNNNPAVDSGDATGQVDTQNTEPVTIAPINPDNTGDDPDFVETAEVVIDVIDPDNRPSDTPGVVGDVSVIPGVKDGE